MSPAASDPPGTPPEDMGSVAVGFLARGSSQRCRANASE